MKNTFIILLITAVCILSCGCAVKDPAVNSSGGEENATAGNDTGSAVLSDDSDYFNKIHFYYSNADHSVIDDQNELREAINGIKEYCSYDNTEDELRIGIVFKIDDGTKANGYSEEYRHTFVENALKTLPAFEYNAVQEISYSPFVFYSVNYTVLNYELVYSLITSDLIANVSVSLPLHPVSY